MKVRGLRMGEFVAVKKSDVAQLSELAQYTFKETFKDAYYTEEDFQRYFEESLSEDVLLAELEHPESWFYYYMEDGDIVGYFKFNIGTAQTEPMGKDYFEVQRIYLLPHAQKGGRGKEIIRFAEKKARELQKPKIWLGVWEENDYAVQFYQSQGFRQTGTHEFRTGDVVDHDLVMEKVLDD